MTQYPYMTSILVIACIPQDQLRKFVIALEVVLRAIYNYGVSIDGYDNASEHRGSREKIGMMFTSLGIRGFKLYGGVYSGADELYQEYVGKYGALPSDMSWCISGYFMANSLEHMVIMSQDLLDIHHSVTVDEIAEAWKRLDKSVLWIGNCTDMGDYCVSIYTEMIQRLLEPFCGNASVHGRIKELEQRCALKTVDPEMDFEQEWITHVKYHETPASQKELYRTSHHHLMIGEQKELADVTEFIRMPLTFGPLVYKKHDTSRLLRIVDDHFPSGNLHQWVFANSDFLLDYTSTDARSFDPEENCTDYPSV